MWEKRRFARFSCCFFCGLPQGYCHGWKEVDGGRFVQTGRPCQYGGVLGRVIVGVMFGRQAREATDGIRGMLELEGVAADTDEMYEWFGKRVAWGGVESTRLCQVFVALCRLDNSSKKHISSYYTILLC